MVQVVHQRAIIQRIAGKHRARLGIPKRDRPRRMTRCVQDLKSAVAQVQHIALIQIAGQGGGGDAVGGGVEIGVQAGVHHLDLGPRPGINHGGIAGVGQNIRLGPVAQTAVKFVQAARMIEMAVGDDGFDGPVGLLRQPAFQRA